MLTEEQTKSIIEAAKADDAAEKLGSLVGGMVQTLADAVVATETKGLKANREEFKLDLAKYAPFGKPEEIKASLEELETLRSAKGAAKIDQKELDRLADEKAQRSIADNAKQGEALLTQATERGDGYKVQATDMLSALLTAHRRQKLLELAPDVRTLQRPYYEDTIGRMMVPDESVNGGEWWKKPVLWKVVNPETGDALTGAKGLKSVDELVEEGRLGLGDRDWNKPDFRDIYFEKKGKGANTVPADGLPATATGHVPADAPSYKHFEALNPTE